MSEPFSLKNVSDFLTIPPDKIEACLTDFWAWLAMVRVAQRFKADGFDIILPETFQWIDDGKHEAAITVSAGGTLIASGKFDFAPPEPAPE